MSTCLKDKLVGGAKTGPMGCGSLGLAHKPFINCSSCRNQISKAFAPIVNSRDPVNWALVNSA